MPSSQTSNFELTLIPFLPVSAALKTSFLLCSVCPIRPPPFPPHYHPSGLDLGHFLDVFSCLFFPLPFGLTLFQALQYIPIRCIFPKQCSNHIIHVFKNFEWLLLASQIKNKCLIVKEPSQSHAILYFQTYLSPLAKHLAMC